MDKGKKFIVGIDPDVDGSGFCLLKRGEMVQLTNLQLWDVFFRIMAIYSEIEHKNFVVLVEKSTSNNTWHKGGKGAAINVGRNKEIANQIIKFCKHHNIPHRAVDPKGFSNVTHESFCSITKTDFKTTNPEKRVAGLFAFHAYRGLV